METKLIQGEYLLTEGKFQISMTVDFKNNNFTLHTKSNKVDFCFLDTNPEVALVIARLISRAADLAIEVLRKHRDGGGHGM